MIKNLKSKHPDELHMTKTQDQGVLGELGHQVGRLQTPTQKKGES